MINSIGKKIGIIFCVLIVITSIDAIILHNINTLSETDAKVINVAGRQRMLSQRMVKDSLIVFQTNGTISADINQLEESIQLFNNSHYGLRYGNIALGLPETFSFDVIEQWEVVHILWINFSSDITELLNNNFSSILIENIIDQSEPLLNNINELVQIFENEATDKNKLTYITLIISWITILIVLLASVFYIIRNISKPIQNLTTQVKEVADGNLKENLPIYQNRNDEIGVLEMNFGIMQKRIQEMVISLEKKVEFLESFLNICAKCKKVRLESDKWVQIETHITNKTGTLFSHGLCPECSEFYLKDLD